MRRKDRSPEEQADMSAQGIRHRLANNPWKVVVQPTGDRFLRYRVQLQQEDTGMVSGPNGGWCHCFTLAGARRVGARQLARHDRQVARKRERQALIDGRA